MKLPRTLMVMINCLAVAFGLQAATMGTAFTYQGQLSDSASPANGVYDLRFSLFDAATGGNQVGSSVVITNVGILNGLFSVPVDFGAEAFSGGERWLEIGVRIPPPPRQLGIFTILSPRQAITPAPYALSAAGLRSPDTGPLDVSVEGNRALRLESIHRVDGMGESSTGINLIGGYGLNAVSANVVGATIAGGGGSHRIIMNTYDYPNSVTGDFGTVGGGRNNTAGNFGTVPGGSKNSASGVGSFAAGRDAHATHAGSFVWNDGIQAANSTGENRFEAHATGGVSLWVGTNTVFSDAMKGFALPGADWPIITRGFDAFGANAPAQKRGLGRWGVFMEPFNIVLGMPGSDIGERKVTIGAYQTNGTYTALFSVRNTDGQAWVNGEVSCTALTIRGGADLAEPFALSEAAVTAGSVVIIDEENPGKLKLSNQPYDRKVAGVVSGAGGIQAGIRLLQEKTLAEGQNIALTGRVYVQADATFGAIKPGDLMTTSGTPGHAMKVTDHDRALGAILGKAMSKLPEGRGLVLVLVSLQ